MLMRSATLAYFAIFAHANEDGISCSGGQCTHEGEGDEVGLLSVRTASNFGPLPPAPTPAQPQLCDPSLDPITEPGAYRDAWFAQGDTGSNKNLPACVADGLFGCFFGCGGKSFYGDSDKAWISPAENLRQYLYLQHMYGADDPQKVAAGAFIIVGFGPPGLEEDEPGMCLGVFTLPDAVTAASNGITPMVPTVNYWFSYMAQAKIPNYPTDNWPVQKALALAYSQLGVGGTTNVLDVFHSLTHCSAKYLAVNGLNEITPDNHTGCNESVVDVFNALDMGTTGLKGCVQAFYANKDNKWSLTDLGDVRMMLYRCFDANPWNTFVGLGWNNYPNPLVCVKPAKQTNLEHYTGAEFVIKNIDFEKGVLEPVQIPFADYIAAENTDWLLTDGFC